MMSHFRRLMVRLLWIGVRMSWDALTWVESATRRMPVVGPARERVEDMVLDTLLGSVEDFEYVSTTAPSSPPPRP